MSSSDVDRKVADDQQASNSKLVEELSKLNSLLRTLIADKGSQEALPRKTEPSMEELVERLKPDTARIHFNYQEIRTFVDVLWPTEKVLQNLRGMFLGVFGIEGIGMGRRFNFWQRYLPLGSSTIQIQSEGDAKDIVPWTQVPKITDPKTQQRVTQDLRRLASTLEKLWPLQVARRDSKEENLIFWNLAKAGCELQRANLLFNGSGYLQTFTVRYFVMLWCLADR